MGTLGAMLPRMIQDYLFVIIALAIAWVVLAIWRAGRKII